MELAAPVCLRDREPIVPNKDRLFIKYYDDISPYRINKYEADSNGKEYYKDYPKLTYQDGSDYQEWTFRGWFHDELCTDGIEHEIVSGGAYAKFVPLILEECRGRTNAGVTMDSSTATYRVIIRSADLHLNKLGMIVETPNGKVREYMASQVYTTLLFGENDEYRIKARETHEAMVNGVFLTYRVSGVPNSFFPQIWTIEGLYLTNDGTKIYGFPNIVRVQDSIENYINIPIVVNTDNQATNIEFNVEYDSTTYSFVEGANTKGLFDTMNVEEVKSGLLKVTLSNADAAVATLEGLLVNLRFKCNSIDAVAPVTTFNVFNENIMNDGNKVYMNIPNGKYYKWVIQSNTSQNEYVW